MPVGLFSGHSPPLGTQDETFLDAERLVDFLEGSGVFAYVDEMGKVPVSKMYYDELAREHHLLLQEPTGPPLKVVMIVLRILLSMVSSPLLSIFSLSSAYLAMPMSM